MGASDKDDRSRKPDDELLKSFERPVAMEQHEPRNASTEKLILNNFSSDSERKWILFMQQSAGNVHGSEYRGNDIFLFDANRENGEQKRLFSNTVKLNRVVVIRLYVFVCAKCSEVSVQLSSMEALSPLQLVRRYDHRLDLQRITFGDIRSKKQCIYSNIWCHICIVKFWNKLCARSSNRSIQI